MRTGLSYHAIEELVVAHPTYAEGLVSLFSNIKPLLERHGAINA
jgi:hypothetical protein